MIIIRINHFWLGENDSAVMAWFLMRIILIWLNENYSQQKSCQLSLGNFRANLKIGTIFDENILIDSAVAH